MKSIKCFAIEDHGMLSVFPEVERHNFKYMVTGHAKTTLITFTNILVRICEMDFSIGILDKPLAALPQLEPEDGKQHFITVRWS